MQSNEITVIIVNFKTPNLVKDAITSFMKCYPNVQYILIDNGGCEESLGVLRGFEKESNVLLVENDQNIGHGFALNLGFELANTEYVFTLDSDTRVEQCGFLEAMISRFEKFSNLFAIGWLRYVNENGVANKKHKTGLPYVHPHAALYKRDLFFQMEPFDDSGAPSILLMKDVQRLGLRLEDFPVHSYIWHKVAGTRGIFRGQYKNIPTDRKPEKWKYHRI